MAENRRPSQRYLSGRVRVTAKAGLGTDRHLYLSPSDAEPNLGFPGEKSVPISGTYYRLITIPNGDTYDRYWQVDSPASLVDGISIFDEGTLVGTANSVSKINFVGSAITATASGSISTVSVSPPGTDKQILFHDLDDFGAASQLFYDKSNNRLGIGVSNPTQQLHLNGDFRIGGKVWDIHNQVGAAGSVLIATGAGVSWSRSSSARVTISDVAPTGAAPGDLWWDSEDGDLNVYFEDVDSSQWVSANANADQEDGLWTLDAIGIHTVSNVGIGTTMASVALAVGGNAIFGGALGGTGIVTATEFHGRFIGDVSGATGVGGTWAVTAAGIHTTKNVGIGITAKAGYQLDVAGITSTSYLDVTNVLSVGGLSTFRANVLLDKSRLHIQDANAQLYRQNDDLHIDVAGNHDFYVTTNSAGGTGGTIYLRAKGNEESIIVNPDSSVDLYFDDSKKLETTSSGINVVGTTTTGQLKVTGFSTFSSAVELDSTIIDIHGQVGAARSVLTATGAGVSWGQGGSGVTLAEDPPPNAYDGDLWWETDTGELAIWYDDGDSAQWVTVSQGPTGPQGPQGVPGAVGAQGAPGAQGYQGKQGAVGAQGHQGDIGAQGHQGKQGAVGAQGHQGDTGAQGHQGKQGDVGAQGHQGHQGDVGAQGHQGHQGAPGTATINNNADNRVITGSNTTGELNAEANLTFDGSALTVTGSFVKSGGTSSQFLKADGSVDSNTYLTTHDGNTTYDLAVPNSTTKIRLTGSDSTTDDVEIAGSGGVTVTRSNAEKLTITGVTYTLPASGTDSTDFSGNGNAIITLTDSNSNTDPVTISAGSNIKITSTSATGFTISAQDTDNNTQLSREQVEDWVGAMFSNNTQHTRITATYQDSDGTIDLVVDDQSSDNNTTYGISCTDGDNSDEEKITLTPSTGTADSIVLEASTGLSIARDGDKITFTNTDTGTGNGWRPIDTVPTQNASADSISSSWAYTHINSLGNSGHVPAAGSAGQFLAHDGNWATPPGTGANYYCDGLAFDTGTGVLTASINGTTNQTVDLDGRYVQSGGTSGGTSTALIRTDNGNAWHNLIFVDSATDNQQQTLKMDDETSQLQWNPDWETLAARICQTQGLKTWAGDFGTAGYVAKSNGSSSAWSWVSPSTLSIAHGSAEQVQYSDGSGGFDSESAFTYDASQNTLNVDKIVSAFQTNQYSGNNITLQTGHTGKVNVMLSNHTFTTVQGNFVAGEATTLVNGWTGDITIVQGSNVLLYLAGTSTTGNRTLGPKGTMTLLLYRTSSGIDYYTCSGTAIS